MTVPYAYVDIEIRVVDVQTVESLLEVHVRDAIAAGMGIIDPAERGLWMNTSEVALCSFNWASCPSRVEANDGFFVSSNVHGSLLRSETLQSISRLTPRQWMGVSFRSCEAVVRKSK